MDNFCELSNRALVAAKDCMTRFHEQFGIGTGESATMKKTGVTRKERNQRREKHFIEEDIFHCYWERSRMKQTRRRMEIYGTRHGVEAVARGRSRQI
jgi:hypothetical protein